MKYHLPTKARIHETGNMSTKKYEICWQLKHVISRRKLCKVELRGCKLVQNHLIKVVQGSYFFACSACSIAIPEKKIQIILWVDLHFVSCHRTIEVSCPYTLSPIFQSDVFHMGCPPFHMLSCSSLHALAPYFSQMHAIKLEH